MELNNNFLITVGESTRLIALKCISVSTDKGAGRYVENLWLRSAENPAQICEHEWKVSYKPQARNIKKREKLYKTNYLNSSNGKEIEDENRDEKACWQQMQYWSCSRKKTNLKQYRKQTKNDIKSSTGLILFSLESHNRVFISVSTSFLMKKKYWVNL